MTLPSTSALVISAMSRLFGSGNIFQPVRSLPLKSWTKPCSSAAGTAVTSMAATSTGASSSNRRISASPVKTKGRTTDGTDRKPICFSIRVDPWLLLLLRPDELGNVVRLRRRLGHVRGHVGLDVADGPVQAAEQQVLEDLVLPNVLAVAHRREEHAALVVH